ncbi:U exon [Bat mastadenovirus]|nr:U exon [Bat mastadenovirus]
MKIKCGECVRDLGVISFKAFRRWSQECGFRFCSWEDGHWIEIYPQEDQSETEIMQKIE